MHTLTREKRETLVEIINEVLGPQLEFDQFADAMLALFEDIAGFETIPEKKAKRLLNQLWRKYRDQIRQQEIEEALCKARQARSRKSRRQGRKTSRPGSKSRAQKGRSQ